MSRILNADGQEANGNGNGRFKITWEKILTWVIAVLLAWSTVNARVSVLESKQLGIEQRLDRMEDKIDVLLQRP